MKDAVYWYDRGVCTGFFVALPVGLILGFALACFVLPP
jgi:hypothetical protein